MNATPRNIRMASQHHGTKVLVVGAILAIATWIAAAAPPAATRHASTATSAPAARVRIGTYDARAIAIAYANSDAGQRDIAAKMKEMKDAQARGDQKKVAELKQWGESHQRRRHLQAFAAAPVDDLLATIPEKLADIAARRQLAAIVRAADYLSPAVEPIDVTDDLVNAFAPTQKGRTWISQARQKPALPLEQVAVMKD